jgi:hypothetical protein
MQQLLHCGLTSSTAVAVGWVNHSTAIAWSVNMQEMHLLSYWLVDGSLLPPSALKISQAGLTWLLQGGVNHTTAIPSAKSVTPAPL